MAAHLAPRRGELRITDINRQYLGVGSCTPETAETAWLTPAPTVAHQASNYIQAIEGTPGLMVATWKRCLPGYTTADLGRLARWRERHGPTPSRSLRVLTHGLAATVAGSHRRRAGRTRRPRLLPETTSSLPRRRDQPAVRSGQSPPIGAGTPACTCTRPPQGKLVRRRRDPDVAVDVRRGSQSSAGGWASARPTTSGSAHPAQGHGVLSPRPRRSPLRTAPTTAPARRPGLERPDDGARRSPRRLSATRLKPR
jgi:hypothetical protein